MKIENNITITITKEDIKKLIRKELEKQGYEVLDFKVDIEKKQWTDGHGLGEIDHEELVFHGFKATAMKV